MQRMSHRAFQNTTTTTKNVLYARRSGWIYQNMKKIKTMTAILEQQKQEYRFLDEKKMHLHQIFVDGEWKNLTGVSSVKELIKPVLSWWAAGKALEKLGWVHPGNEKKGFVDRTVRISSLTKFLEETENWSMEQLLERYDEAYKAHAVETDRRAEEGTDTHAVVEEYVKRCIAENKGKLLPSENETIRKFLNLVEAYDPVFLASEEHCWDRELWLGGIADLVVQTKQGLGVWDVKTRKVIYPEDFIQMGAYALMLEKKYGMATHLLGVALPNKGETGEVKIFLDPTQAIESFKGLLKVYRLLEALKI